MTSTTEPAAGDNTASDETTELQQLQAALAALNTAVESLNTAASISETIGDPGAAKILNRVSRQACEIKQIYTAAIAIHKLQYIRIGPNDDTAAPQPQPTAAEALP